MSDFAWNTTVKGIINWQPPPLSALNFNPKDNDLCAAAGAWKAENANLAQENLTFITANFVVEYLRAILLPKTSPPDKLTLLSWYDNYILNDTDSEGIPFPGSLAEKLDFFPIENCAMDVCRNLDWAGDPDVSGRGMLITYYIAAGLVTTYLCAINVSNLGLVKDRYSTSSTLHRLFSGFEESISTFLDSALVFSVSMLAAACFRLSQALLQNSGAEEGHWMIYATITSIHISTFSVFLPLVLYYVAQGTRKHWLRIVLWTLIALFCIVNEVLYDVFAARVSVDKPTETVEVMWALLCNPTTLSDYGLLLTFRLAQILLFLNAICSVVGMCCRGRRKDDKKSSRLRIFWQRTKRVIKKLNTVLCSFLMWTMLGLFHAYRDSVNRVAGEKNENSNWTFGQVLAVATWIPVLVELLAVMKHGPLEGLSRKVSTRYVVVPNTEPSHDEERELQYMKVGGGTNNSGFTLPR